MRAWSQLPLLTRIRHLRYILPPILALLVVFYQLEVARRLAERYGHAVHYSVEIVFYSLSGPVVTWLTLVWIERKLAEKEALERQVRAREKHLAGLTDASADAILSLDRQDCIASWNRGAEQLFGYTAAEMVGQPLHRLLPEADRLAEQLARDGVVRNFETIARTRRGRPITVDLTQTRLDYTSPHAPASSLILRDITARRERDAIIEEERARIARDLHDGVAQTLYFLALKADMAARQVAQSPEAVAPELAEIGRQARRIIRQVRRTIFALRPLDWETGDFLPALRHFAVAFAEQVGWQLSFEVPEEMPDIPPRLEPTLFRLVQESLNNVAKHTTARRVWIRLACRPDPPALELTIRDDGGGFAPEAANGHGLGLQQMRHRAEAAGGTFHLQNRPGEGVTVSAVLPLPAQKELS
ncbi:MAG: PAS domain S-box protein [Caldilineae bacterium]|nr:MAG: PAS domain S-box protein [Caldilineae bacterium]